MSVAFNGPLLFAGAGKMGGAILKGLLARGLDPSTVVVQDPTPPQAVMDLLAEHAIKTVPDAAAVDVTPAVILVAVKPQIMDDVLPALARLAGPQTLIVSIAAGRRIANFEQYFADAAVVRAPNGLPRVWAKEGPQLFKPLPVHVAPLDGEHVVILDGVEAGERIVVDGAELINQVR